MKKLFHNYKREYEMSVAVMGAMAEEIVNLRKDNETLACANVELQKENDKLRDDLNDMMDICNGQSETISMLQEKFRKAREALAK